MPKLLRALLQILLLAGIFTLGLKLGPGMHQQFALWFPAPDFEIGNFDALRAKPADSVLLFGSSTCPHCIAARRYFVQARIPFEDIVIDQSESANTRFEQLQSDVVPVVIIGNRKIIGWRPDVVVAALAAQHLPAAVLPVPSR